MFLLRDVLFKKLCLFAHDQQIYFICSHLYFSIKDEMFKISIKYHLGGSMTSWGVHKQHQRIPQTPHLQRYITWVTCFQILSKYVSLHFIMPFYALLDSNVALSVLRYHLSSNTKYMEWPPGAVAVDFRDVPQRHFQCCSLYLIHFWLRYTEVKYQLKQSY